MLTLHFAAKAKTLVRYIRCMPVKSLFAVKPKLLFNTQRFVLVIIVSVVV